MSTKENQRKGHISVRTTDIFPIIKKWLYSEHDIFLRELIANGTDAITKRKAKARTHNVELPEGKIILSVDKDKKVLKISDNGIGMTEKEVETYIAQLAFSGAEEFVQKIKMEKEKGEDIIGKFGLGFYSSFMVADKVEVESLSWEDGALPTKWSCEGDTEYAFLPSEKKQIGTEITLFINEESKEFLNDWKILETLKKFCNFMPYPIEVMKSERPKKKEEDDHWKVNETFPLWRKDPKEIKEEEYKEFYHSLFPMDADPLFWIHLKVDHPFVLEGILYFPKMASKMSFQEKHIRLYCKQVFVANNVKEIIPEFLSLLKGVIDSTDIPLNVSRSSLQGDPNIKRISGYIIKKVAMALKTLFRDDRKRFEEIWGDIGLFVKYGCISDNKFDELMRDQVIFKTHQSSWKTMGEYRQEIPPSLQQKLGDKILYFEREKGDKKLLAHLEDQKLLALETDTHIDPHFLQHCETKILDEKKVQFSSLAAEISEIMGTGKVTPSDIKVKQLFEKVLGEKKKEKEQGDKESIELQKFKDSGVEAFFKVDEQAKRFSKITESMGQTSSFPLKRTLVINPEGALIKNILSLHEEGKHQPIVKKLCHYVEDLALISGEGLKNEKKDDFLHRTQELMQDLTNIVRKNSSSQGPSSEEVQIDGH